MSILLIGAKGYIGSAFAAELNRREIEFEPPTISWNWYSKLDAFVNYLVRLKATFVINAAGYTGKPNVDACEHHKYETLAGNVILPTHLCMACLKLDIPWLHVSSGCIYNGPGPFKEIDIPNFSFDHPPCSFYSGSKALAEACIAGIGQSYICRLRLPFDEFDGPRNYLSKLQRYPRLLNATNSITHRGEFVKAALDLWQRRAAYGTYNMTNPGWISTRQVVLMMHNILRLDREWDFFADDGEFYASGAAMMPRSNCTLDVSKLHNIGIEMRPVEVAIKESLEHWRKE